MCRVCPFPQPLRAVATKIKKKKERKKRTQKVKKKKIFLLCILTKKNKYIKKIKFYITVEATVLNLTYLSNKNDYSATTCTYLCWNLISKSGLKCILLQISFAECLTAIQFGVFLLFAH